MWESSIPVLVFESKSGRIVSANDAAATLFKSSPEEMKGQSVNSCVATEERQRLEASVGNTEPRWGEVGPWRCVARDNSRFTVRIRYHQSIVEGKLVHVVLVTEVVRVQSAMAAAAGIGNWLPRCG